MRKCLEDGNVFPEMKRRSGRAVAATPLLPHSALDVNFEMAEENISNLEIFIWTVLRTRHLHFEDMECIPKMKWSNNIKLGKITWPLQIFKKRNRIDFASLDDIGLTAGRSLH